MIYIINYIKSYIITLQNKELHKFSYSLLYHNIHQKINDT